MSISMTMMYSGLNCDITPLCDTLVVLDHEAYRRVEWLLQPATSARGRLSCHCGIFVARLSALMSFVGRSWDDREAVNETIGLAVTRLRTVVL